MRSFLIVLLLLMAAPAAAQNTDALVRAYFQAWNAGDAETIGRLVGERVSRRTGGVADIEGREALLALLRSQHERSPGVVIEPESVVASRDRVAVAWRARAPGPDAEEVRWTGSSHFRVERGRIVEERVVGDLLGMYRQRGYTLAPPAPRLDAVAAIRPRLDHFMWFVHDLPAARALLADTLGFTVSQGGSMSWGAENQLVWFEDDSYLEPLLLRDPAGNEYWGPFVRRHQGGTAFGLRVPSAQQAHDYFAARGLRVTEPYSATFERMGAITEMPDDMWRVVSSAGGGFLGDLIFWIEYTEAWDALHRRHPEIDRRRGTAHANTARRVARYDIASYNADRMAELFERLGFAVGEAVELPHLDAMGREVRVEGGSLMILQPRLVRSPVFAFLRERGEGVMGAAVEVADVEAARALIAGRSGWALEPYDTPAGRAFAVPARSARGVRLEFVQMR